MKKEPMKKETVMPGEGVRRKYFEAAPNPMFSEIERASILFVRYETAVPCGECGRKSRHHWTCYVRFKAANPRKGCFTLPFGSWLKEGTPVCRAHPLKVDEEAFVAKVRKAREAKKAQQTGGKAA
jgi:hypothetical protein